MFQHDTQPGIPHDSHPLHHQGIDILRKVLELFLPQKLIILGLVHQQRRQNLSHRNHLNRTGLSIIRREQLIDIFGKFLLSPRVGDSRVPVLLDNLPQKDMSLHVGLQQRLQLVKSRNATLNDLLCALNPLLLYVRQDLQALCEQELLVQGKRLLEHALLPMIVVVIVGQVGFLLKVVVVDYV